MEKNNNTIIWIMIIIIVALIACVGGYYFGKNYVAKSPKTEEKTDKKDETKDNYDIVQLDIDIVSKSEKDFIEENKKEAEQYDNVSLIDFDNIKTKLNEKNNRVVIRKDADDVQGVIYEIENNKVVVKATYQDINSDTIKNTKFVINNIENPVGIYSESNLGGEDSFPVNIYVLDNSNNVYVVHFLLRSQETGGNYIYKLNII